RAFRYAPLSNGLCSNSKVCAELVVTDTFRHCFLVAHAASRRDDAGRRWRRFKLGSLTGDLSAYMAEYAAVQLGQDHLRPVPPNATRHKEARLQLHLDDGCLHDLVGAAE